MFATFETVHLVFKEPPHRRRGATRFPTPARCQPLRGPETWWRRRDSNPRPPGCKPGALPTELRPPARARITARACIMVGLSGLEPLTSRLSGGRSNQLSYRPEQAQRPFVRLSSAERLWSRKRVALVAVRSSYACRLSSPPAEAVGSEKRLTNPLERR